MWHLPVYYLSPLLYTVQCRLPRGGKGMGKNNAKQVVFRANQAPIKSEKLKTTKTTPGKMKLTLHIIQNNF
jgi:hypothetical protein